MKKRIFALVLALCIVVSMMPAVAAAGYHDTDGHWAEDAIARWSEHGIVEGSDGLFSPDGELTRGALMTIIARLLKLPAAPDAGFADTDGHWAEDFINRCAAAGIVKGDGVNANPDDLISREETMVMLGRALGIKPVENADLSHYEDDHAVSDWAEGYVAAMTGAGIINGIDGNLAPDAEIDRASTMTILDRAITTYVTEPGTTVESDGGIIVVAAENVTITGEADTVLVTQGAAGGTTMLENVNVGTVTVQAEDSAVVVGENTVAVEVTVTETAAGSAVEVDKKAEVGTVTTSAAESTVSVSGTVGTVETTEQAAGATVEVTKDAVVENVTAGAAESTVSVSGTVTNVTVTETAEGATVETEKGAAIENVTTEAENTTVTGTGKVENVTTSGDNTTVETNGTKVEAAEGTTGTTAGGKEVEGGESATTTPTTPSTPSVSEHYCRYSATVTAPTCTDKGYTTYTCVCGHSYVDDYVDKLGHDFTGNYTYDETGHWHICAREGCTVTDTKAAHVGLGTVCNVATSCTDCGYVKAAGEHIWNNGVVTTAPTCSATGVKTFTCTTANCGATKTEAVAIDANAHKWGEYTSNNDATCEEDGTKTAECDNGCGEEKTVTDAGSKLTHQDGEYCATCKKTFVSTAAGLTKAVAAGGNIVLENAITLTAPITVTGTVIIDLNGCIMSYESNVAGEDMITNKGTLTITDNSDGENGEITYVNTDATANNVTVSTISTEPGSTLIIKAGTVENKSVKASDSAIYPYAIDILTNDSLGDVTVTIEGGTVYSDYVAIRQFNNGDACKNTLTVEDGEIYGAKRAIQIHFENDAAYTTISGGEIEGGDYSLCFLTTSKNISVTCGTFIGSVWYSGTAGFISGGTFSEEPDAAYVAEGYEAFKNEDDTYTVGVQVIDSEAELVAAIAKGGTVTLGGDIELTNTLTIAADKTVVLDLNGKTITYDSTTQGEAMITNKGTLTINDSVGTGVINYNYTGAADSSYGKGNYTIDNGGTLTVNGGKITIANLRAHAKYPINNNSTTGDAILVINGGHLYNYNTSAIRQFCNSENNTNSVSIKGGLIEGYCAIWMQNPGSKTVNGCLSIEGGEIKTTAKAYVEDTSKLKDVSSGIYCTTEGGNWDDESYVSITGGTINENVNLAEEAPASLNINQTTATFNGNINLPTAATEE